MQHYPSVNAFVEGMKTIFCLRHNNCISSLIQWCLQINKSQLKWRWHVSVNNQAIQSKVLESAKSLAGLINTDATHNAACEKFHKLLTTQLSEVDRRKWQTQAKHSFFWLVKCLILVFKWTIFLNLSWIFSLLDNLRNPRKCSLCSI